VAIHVEFRCDGCAAKAYGTGFLGAQSWDVADLAPNGWVPRDPYTHCCYCPQCWAEILIVRDEEPAAPDA